VRAEICLSGIHRHAIISIPLPTGSYEVSNRITTSISKTILADSWRLLVPHVWKSSISILDRASALRVRLYCQDSELVTTDIWLPIADTGAALNNMVNYPSTRYFDHPRIFSCRHDSLRCGDMIEKLVVRTTFQVSSSSDCSLNRT